MAEHQTSRLRNKQPTVNFCSNCAFRVEKSYHFCPKCDEGIKTNGNVDDGIVDRKKELETTSTDTSCRTSKFALPRFALPSFAPFKSTKEKERQSFFWKKSGGKTKNEKFRQRKLLFRLA